MAKAAFRVSVKTPFAASSWPARDDFRDHRRFGWCEEHGDRRHEQVQQEQQQKEVADQEQADHRQAAQDVGRDEHESTVDTVHVDPGHRRHEHGRHQERQDQQADRGIRVVLGDDDRQPEQHHVPADLGRCLRQPQSEERGIAEDRERAFGGDFLCGLVDRFDVDGHPRVGHEGRSGGVRRRGGTSPTTAAVIAGSPRSTNACEPSFERGACDQHVAVARPAADADVRAEPVDEPGVAAARVRPTKADHVPEQQVHDGSVRHGGQGIRGVDGHDSGRGHGPSPAQRCGPSASRRPSRPVAWRTAGR